MGESSWGQMYAIALWPVDGRARFLISWTLNLLEVANKSLDVLGQSTQEVSGCAHMDMHGLHPEFLYSPNGFAVCCFHEGLQRNAGAAAFTRLFVCV